MIHFLKVPYRDNYPIREAAYGLLIKEDRIALVNTPRGIFLPGGGIEGDETQEACIVREYKEELGMTVVAEAHVLSTVLSDVTPSRDFPIDMIGHCWFVSDMNLDVPAVEDDHELIWLSLEEASRKLRLVHQAWVMETLVSEKRKKTIVQYNPHWSNWFEAIWLHLAEVLGGHCRAIEHVGSTSIPGMMAKPVIDIDIVIEKDEDFAVVCQRLSLLGYEHNGDQGIAGREAFIRDVDQKHELLDQVPHHLYVCDENSEELKRHTHFRDRLKQDDTLRDAYNAVKEEIISAVGPYDKAGYVELKANNYRCFFNEING